MIWNLLKPQKYSIFSIVTYVKKKSYYQSDEI